MKFRFTIRDLLWLTALVAVCVAWWLDHSALVKEQDDVTIKLLKLTTEYSPIPSAPF